MQLNKYVLSLVLVTALMTGCSTGEAISAQPAGDDSETKSTASVPAENSEQTDAPVKAVDENQQNSMVLGKIVTVYGNYIEVDKVDMPERTGEKMRENNNTEAAENQQTNLASAMGSGGMSPGVGGMPPGAGMRGGGSTDTYTYSGEIVNIMIPVGSEITSMSDDALELTYDSLKKGMVVRVKMDMDMTNEFQDTTEDEIYYADNVLVME
jgi:hypothetical protein